MQDLIDRQVAIDAFEALDWYHVYRGRLVHGANSDLDPVYKHDDVFKTLEGLPPTLPTKEIPKRVTWTGWKGHRDTRYKCPGCNKPVRNDDVYCHRCGQKLMFPHIDWTPYVEGQKQELIVRWDDE